MTATTTRPAAGTLVDGRYRVVRHLADGGMGSVHLAVDERLERRVALKVMRPELARDAAFVERFRREARAAARLSHPHVVAVFDQGRDADLVYLAMELVEGATLREMIDSCAPLPVGSALALADPVLQALAAAHEAGIVHRDIKPENVLVSAAGAVKVADFGLARALVADTLTGARDGLLGTASYASPEQLEHGRVDRRSDVYAAGLVLHELLTGRRAVDGGTPVEIAYRQVHGPRPVPSALVATVPPAVDALVAAAVAVRPDARPPDAATYLDLLRRTWAGLTPDQLATPPRAAATPSGRPPAAAPQGRPAPAPTETIPRAAATSALPSPPPSCPVAPAPAAGRPTGSGTGPSRRGLVLAGATGLGLLAAGGGWWRLAGPGSGVTVPALAGMPREQADRALAAADLTARVREQTDEQVPAGTVVTSSPPAGTRTDPGSSVEVVVSTGPARVAVPDLVGRTRREAVDAVRRAGLEPQVAADRVAHRSVPAGSVAAQEPSAGTLRRGATVRLTLSSGPPPVIVPLVTGRSSAQARATLEALGLAVREERYLGGLLDVVRQQQPTAGTAVPPGSEVLILIL